MIGVVGLDLCGMTLSLNIARNDKVQLFSPMHYAKLKKIQRQNPKEMLEGKLVGHSSLQGFVESFDPDDQNVIITCVNGEKNATKIVQQLANLLGEGDCILDFGKTVDMAAIKQRYLSCGLHGVEYMDCSLSSPYHKSVEEPAIVCSGGSTVAAEELLSSISSNVLFIDHDAGNAKYVQMLISSLESAFLQSICDVYAYCNFDQSVLSRVLLRVKEDYPVNCPLVDVVLEVCKNPNLSKISGSCTVDKTLYGVIRESLHRGTPFAVQGSGILHRAVVNRTTNTHVDHTKTQPEELVACNALLFAFSAIIVETMNLLDDDPHVSFDRLARFLQHPSCSLSCLAVGLEHSQLHDMMDVTYSSAKNMLLNCVNNHRAVPVISNAINEYNSIQNPRKGTNVLMASYNHMYGERISYVQHSRE